MKDTKILLVIVLFSNVVFSQNINVNSGWIGAVKDIATSPRNKYISVTGEKHVHLFESVKLNQTIIVKAISHPKKSLFYKDDVLIVLSNQNTYKYSIENRVAEILTTKTYECGYVDYTNNMIYLANEKTLDIYQDLKLKKTLPLENNCKSIISTDEYLILGYQDGNIRVHKKSDFSIVKTLQGHKTGVNNLSISNSNNTLLSGASRDYRKAEFGESILWDIKTGNILFRTYDNHKEVKSVHLDEDKMFISSLREIRIYNLNGDLKKSIQTYPYTNPIFTIAKDKMIYGIADVGQTSNNLYEIKLDSNFTKRRLSHDSRQIWDLNFYDNNLVIIKDNEFSILSSNGQIITYPLFSHGKDIVYKDSGQIIGINIEESKLSDSLLFLTLNNPNPVYIPIPSDVISKRFSSDFISFNNDIYSLTNDNLLNISKNQTLLDFSIPSSNDSSLFSKINSDDFFNVRSPIRKFIQLNSELMFYEYDRRNFVLNIRSAKNGTYLKQVKDVKRILSQQENFLNILDNSTNSVSTLDLTNMVITSNNNIHNASNIYKVKYNSSRKLIAVKHGEYGNKISIINLNTSQNIPIRPKSRHIDCFAFSPNNKYLLTGNRYGEIEIWDTEKGEYVGLVFTGSLKNEYVVISDKNLGGTINGVSNFLNINTLNFNLQNKGFIKPLLFE